MIVGLMRHRVNLWRPIYIQGTTQEILDYRRVRSNIPAFIQPVSSVLEDNFQQRTLTDAVTIFTSDTVTSFEREDVLEWNGHQYHILGIVSGLESNIYQELTCEEYPETARKRLNMEDYP